MIDDASSGRRDQPGRTTDGCGDASEPSGGRSGPFADDRRREPVSYLREKGDDAASFVELIRHLSGDGADRADSRRIEDGRHIQTQPLATRTE